MCLCYICTNRKTIFDRVYLNLTFESRVRSVLNLQTIGNHCAECEHPWSKMKEEFALQAKPTDGGTEVRTRLVTIYPACV